MHTARIEYDEIEVTRGGLYGETWDRYRSFAQGMPHYFIDDREVTREEFEAFVTEHASE